MLRQITQLFSHPSAKKEPGAQLLQHVRLRLTLWYSAVLACALLLFCVSLYFGLQHLLYAPVQQLTPQGARAIAELWQRTPDFDCHMPPPNSPGLFPPEMQKVLTDADNSIYVACYDQHLNLIHALQENLPTRFLQQNAVVAQAAQTRELQSGIIESGSSAGRIYCYAMPVLDPQHQLIGVVLVGRSLAELDTALNALLSLVFTVGLLILCCASIGGLFLANRALQPTREAFTRQQRFIADASHELRTPLTFLCANSEILLEGRERLEPDDVALLEEIYREANHMNVLASNMLALARLDAPESQPHYEPDVVDLSTLVAHLVRQGQALAREKQVELQLGTTESVLVLADPVLLDQLALILLENAIKYNRTHGRVTISTSRDHEMAYLCVSDTGPGIAPEHLSRLGERFYRVDKARSRAAGGTGLGLSIAHSIARLHKGSLQLESTLNVGTTALLSLPALPLTPRPSRPHN